MYTKYRDRYKWKQKGLATLYLIFLLATVGEFFCALEDLNHDYKYPTEVEEEVKIPPHVPEESKVEFIRILKIKGTHNLRGQSSSSDTG